MDKIKEVVRICEELEKERSLIQNDLKINSD